jgi:hypothetical protein
MRCLVASNVLLTTVETDRRVRLIERVFTVLEEAPVVYPEWRWLVMDYSVVGVQVHDGFYRAAPAGGPWPSVRQSGLILP